MEIRDVSAAWTIAEILDAFWELIDEGLRLLE